MSFSFVENTLLEKVPPEVATPSPESESLVRVCLEPRGKVLTFWY